MSETNTDNKITIDNYIRNNDCKLIQTRTEYMKGEPVTVQGYKLPRKLIYYNIKNGRFAKEYIKILRDEGGSLKPELEDDAKKITNLLLGLNPLDTKRSLEDIKKRGQTDLGLITQDGYLIDGNRRMALLTELFEDEHNQKYEYINVARIETPISPKDLWAMEAQISLGHEPKVRYGALNELLKLDEGRKAGFTPDEIAELLYGIDDSKEIIQKLNLLTLIKKYLREYFQDEENLSLAEGSTNHFINLQDLMTNAKSRNKTIDEIAAYQKVVFRLIYEKVPHMRIRTINHAIKNDYSLEKIIQAANNMEEKIEVIVEPENDDEEVITPTTTRFADFEDEIKARKNEDKIPLILNSILNNFNVLKFDDPILRTKESKHQIQSILEYMEKLSNIPET